MKIWNKERTMKIYATSLQWQNGITPISVHNFVDANWSFVFRGLLWKISTNDHPELLCVEASHHITQCKRFQANRISNDLQLPRICRTDWFDRSVGHNAVVCVCVFRFHAAVTIQFIRFAIHRQDSISQQPKAYIMIRDNICCSVFKINASECLSSRNNGAIFSGMAFFSQSQIVFLNQKFSSKIDDYNYSSLIDWYRIECKMSFECKINQKAQSSFVCVLDSILKWDLTINP